MESGNRSNEMLSVRIGKGLATDLEMYAASQGETRSEAARELLAEALFAKRERDFAKVCRLAVRDELNKWLDSARMQKEYAADDFYDRLAAAVSTELADISRLAGASLFASIAAAAQTDGSAAADWDEWYSRALALSWTMGLGGTLSECERDAASLETVL